MKSTIKLTAVIAVGILAGFACEASGQDRQTLSFQNRANARALVFKNSLTRPQNWRKQVTTRATHDTYVYRHENRATARSEEISSPEMIFHAVRGQRVRGGHVYQRRAK